MQKKAVPSYDLLKNLGKSSSYIILHTMDGEIVGASPAAADELGYSEDEIKQIYLANIKPKTLRLSDVCRSNKELDAPIIFERRNGRRFPAKVKSTVLRSIINRATTNVVHLEFSIINDVVVDKNQPEVKFDLQESADYLDLLAQEVSTPMNGIMSALTILKNTPLDDEQKKLLMLIRDASTELNSMTGQVVDSFKLGVKTFQLTLQPFNLIDLFDDLVDCHESRIRSQNVDLNVSVAAALPELVFGDAPRVRQLFDSLMRVVFKYCSQGQVVFQASSIDDSDDKDRIAFELSFSSSLLELTNTNRILQMLRRSSEDKTSSQPDFGIHLSIAERLVQLMGGKLEFSYDGSHTGSFSFDINLPEVHSLDMAGNTNFLKGRRVLLVDNRRALLSTQLQQWGARVDQFESIASVVERLTNGEELAGDRFIVILNQGINDEYQIITEPFRKMLEGSQLIFIKAHQEHSYLESAIEMSAPYRLGQLGNELAKLLDADYPYPYTYNNRRRLLKEQNLQRRLLLVEDSPSYRNVTTEILESASYDVDLAYNGIDAVLACADKQYDLILMDIQMPYMDGIEATTHIRKNCLKNGKTLIVALSGDESKNTRVALDSVGIKDSLMKPVSREILLDAVATLLRGESYSDISPKECIEQELTFLQRRTADCNDLSQVVDDVVLNDEILNRLVKDTSWNACHDMISIFLDESEDSLSGIMAGCEDNDVTKIAQESHAIKSASRTFGCDALHNIAKSIEERALESDISECMELVKQLPEVFASSRLLLNDFQDKLAVP